MNLRRALATCSVAALVGCGAPQESAPPIWFDEEATVRGLDFAHVSGASGSYMIPEITGSGAALADFDGDGDLDAYIVQSGSLTGEPEAADQIGRAHV